MARASRQRTRRRNVDADTPPVDPDDDRTEEEREAARGRFSEPFISYLWHADGTPYTDDEYRAMGIDPPAPGEQEELIILEE